MVTLLNNIQRRELNDARDMMVIMLDNLGRIIFINKMCEILTGYSFKDVVNRKFWDIVSQGEDAEQIKLRLQEFDAEHFPHRFRVHLVLKNGEQKPIDLTSNVLLNREEKADRIVFYGSEADECDQSVQEDGQPLPTQLAVSAAFNGHCFWITNCGGKILDVSDSYCALTGYIRPELLKMTISDIDDSFKPADVKARLQNVINQGSRHFTCSHKCRDGVNVEFKVLANYTAAFGGLIFFTTTPSCEEKNKESHVGKVSEQKHGLKARMLDYCNDAIFIHDFNGNFTFINSTAYEKLGCSREELMDMNLADFTSAQNPEIVEQNMRRLIDKGQIQYQGEYNCKNGDVIKVDVKSQVMEIGNKKMILTVARDITELEELRTEHKKNSENTAQPNNDNAVKEQVSEAESPCVDQVNKQVVAGGANEINDKLVKWLSVLDQSRNEIALASKMSSFLQSCINMQEANRVITQFLPLLFPTVDGALYLLDSSAETYELLSSWGNNLESDDSFTPDACIAVRRRTAHHVKCGENEDYCSHFAKGINRGYMDIPLTSQGKILGILHLEGKDEVAESDTGNTLTGMAKNLAMIVAGQLAFAVSNIRLQEAVREQTIRDSLTGLYNRRYMEQALDKEIRHAVRSNSTVGMITLDLDSFGKFNEIHGYKSGNLVMRELADFLRSNSHSGDIVCRGNGDEFAILYPQISSDMLKQKAEGIREGLTYFNRRHQELYKEPLTLSLGVAIFPEDGKTPEQIIKLSEIALNRAAQDGGNRIVLAESSAVI